MLKITNVTAKNFMSIGNTTQAVNFDDSQLTLVIGHNMDLGGDGSRNGTGKTTIINALSYAMYGDALTNIRKDNLINKTNGKHMLVTVDFEIDGTQYRIERGRRPAVLKLTIDGSDPYEQVDDEQQGDNRETQKDINRIIGIPHVMFKHIIALNTYNEPFLGMRTADQRDMIEQLFGITELSLKAEILKERIKETRDAIKEEEFRIAAVKNSNQRIENSISEIESKSRAWNRSHENKMLDIGETIVNLEKINIDDELANHELTVQIIEDKTRKATLEKELRQIDTSFKRSEKNLSDYRSNLQDALDGVCYACGQDTAHLETHEKYTEELREKIATEEDYYQTLVDKITKLDEQINAIVIADMPTTSYKSKDDALQHKHNLDSLRESLVEKTQEQNPYVEQIEELKVSGLEEISYDTINNLTYEQEHQDFLYKLLTSKDSFIRKKIIDQNINYLNHRLSYYLEKIGLPHEVKFQSDLSVEIMEHGRDLDFDNLSRGERNRLILSLSWAFRDIYESLNRPINLMCIDELIDSGMDTVGVENSLAILKKMNRDHNKNIFLISHKEELMGRVNNVLTVIKEGGYTSYSNSTDYIEGPLEIDE